MNSLFKESTIENIKMIKKWFLWAAVCILIGEVTIGAILILAQSFNDTIGKILGTFAVCAIMLFFGVNNFSRMEKGDRIVQGYALVSLICNFIWLTLAIMLIWEVEPFMEETRRYSHQLTGLAKMFSVAIDIAIMCFLVSNVWSIKETIKPVRPLKITAIFCALYCGIYYAVMTLGDVRNENDARWHALAGLAILTFIVMVCAASIVSKSGAKKAVKESNAGVGDINNEEMQVKIQAMVEKEVQERLKEEKKKAELNDMPSSEKNDGDTKNEEAIENKTNNEAS